MAAERAAINKILNDRQIRFFVHFTPLENLPAILESGLIPRQVLEETGAAFQPTDPDRLDGLTGSLSLSVSHPNCEMLFSKMMADKSKKWCVISLWADRIIERDCLYHYHNAAYKDFRNVPLDDRRTAAAFEAMFADVVETDKKTYRRTSIKDFDKPKGLKYATSPQAEILCLEAIPVTEIAGVSFYDDETLMACGPLLQRAGIDSYSGVFRWAFTNGPYTLDKKQEG